MKFLGNINGTNFLWLYGDYKRKDYGCPIKTDSIKDTSI